MQEIMRRVNILLVKSLRIRGAVRPESFCLTFFRDVLEKLWMNFVLCFRLLPMVSNVQVSRPKALH